jgi:hypothetical protein
VENPVSSRDPRNAIAAGRRRRESAGQISAT